MNVEIYCDGACRGNPGPSAAGAVLSDMGSRKVIAEISERLGRGTNNEAEYAALLLALKEARRLGATEVTIKADSQLVIRQLTGQYKVKHPGMKLRHAEAMALLSGFLDWNASHVPREENTRADALANAALDRI
ncbi:MAG: ribonuclease HI family protein [candidate division FCPU426 bacterium]